MAVLSATTLHGSAGAGSSVADMLRVAVGDFLSATAKVPPLLGSSKMLRCCGKFRGSARYREKASENCSTSKPFLTPS